jgi:hypothetical protein
LPSTSDKMRKLRCRNERHVYDEKGPRSIEVPRCERGPGWNLQKDTKAQMGLRIQLIDYMRDKSTRAERLASNNKISGKNPSKEKNTVELDWSQ